MDCFDLSLSIPSAFERKLKKRQGDEVNSLESFGLPYTKAELLSSLANKSDTFPTHSSNFNIV